MPPCQGLSRFLCSVVSQRGVQRKAAKETPSPNKDQGSETKLGPRWRGRLGRRGSLAGCGPERAPRRAQAARSECPAPAKRSPRRRAPPPRGPAAQPPGALTRVRVHAPRCSRSTPARSRPAPSSTARSSAGSPFRPPNATRRVPGPRPNLKGSPAKAEASFLSQALPDSAPAAARLHLPLPRRGFPPGLGGGAGPGWRGGAVPVAPPRIWRANQLAPAQRPRPRRQGRAADPLCGSWARGEH